MERVPNENIGDFDFTELSLPFSQELMDDDADMRRIFYSVWANSDDVVSLYHRVVTLLTDFFKSYYISEKNDLLVSFIKRENPKTKDVTISCQLDHEVQIQDFCLPRPILISEEILSSNNRSYATTKTKKVGYHHLYIHNIVDSSSEDDILDEPPKKLMKTCQDSIFIPCDDLLTVHRRNHTVLTGTDTKLEVLILCKPGNTDICRAIEVHLGLIFVDDLLKSMTRKTVSEKDLLLRLQNKESREYRRLQNHIMKLILFGRNCVCITCSTDIFTIFNANIKAIIHSKWSAYSCYTCFANMMVKIPEDDILQYVSAISCIIDNCNVYTSSVQAVYHRKSDKEDEDGKYYKVKVPIISIIPSYIINLIAQRKLVLENVGKPLIEQFMLYR